jgi:hypothetical protein
MFLNRIAVSVLSLGLLFAAPPNFKPTPEMLAVVREISADSLLGHLSFLSSDLLEGRDTPSRGLDIAAEYIAAQFHRAGLEFGGDDGYYQNAKMTVRTQNLDGFVLALADGDRKIFVPANNVSIRAHSAIDLRGAAVFKLGTANKALVDGLTPEQVDDRVVLVEFERGGMANGRVAIRKLMAASPALIITIDRRGDFPRAEGVGGALIDPEDHIQEKIPRITVTGDEASKFYDSLSPGQSKSAQATVHIAAPIDDTTHVRNVVGILRGSDPELRETCVLVSAHYDHLGELPSGDGDRIYNGANDDGSGTVSVIEVASALAHLKPRPRRSIVFVAFFGEEKGLFGSRYYARHPAFPISKTVAQLNLEQLGRTDGGEGVEPSSATLTGFDFSSVPDVVKAAGELTGVRVYKDEKNSDLYFNASDNLSLADVGVPAHTLCVAYEFPDYHAVGDEWQKIDFTNMARIDRMIATAVIMLANDTDLPHWNADNPKAQKYLDAWKRSQAESDSDQ